MERLSPQILLLKESKRGEQFHLTEANEQFSDWLNIDPYLEEEKASNNTVKRHVSPGITNKSSSLSYRRYSPCSNWTKSLKELNIKFEHFADSSCYIEQYRRAKQLRIEERFAKLMQLKERTVSCQNDSSFIDRNLQTTKQDGVYHPKKEQLSQHSVVKQCGNTVKPSLPQTGYFAGRKWVYPKDFARLYSKNIGVKCGRTELKRTEKLVQQNSTKMFLQGTDGSDASFYISRIRKSRNWVIRLQAGGSCVLFSECYDRKTTPFGSSKYLPDFMTGTFLTSDDPSVNPTFYRWNKVFIPYCSGDLFVGRKHAKDHGFGLPMLGHYIVTSVVRQLIQDYKINIKHTNILFGGASAGGIGMLSNVDHVAKMVRPARVLGYNDGGWFTLYRNYLEPTGIGAPEFLTTLRYLFKNYWDGFVDESCRAQMPQPAACLYGEMVIRHLSTPIFVMVSLWDSYQLKELNLDKYQPVHLPPSSHKETQYLAQFGNNTYKSIRRLIHSNRSGVFSPACVAHTFAGVNETEAAITMKYKIAGVTPYEALSEWYNTRGRRGTYADIPEESPRCNPTCCSKYCSRCSRASNMVVVKGKRQQTRTEFRTEIIPEFPTTIRSNAERLRTISFVYVVLFVVAYY